MDLRTMSDAELTRLDIVKQLDTGRLSRRQAAQLLDRSVRQTQRLLTRYRQLGVDGLVSQQRGRPSNRTLPAAFREYSLHLVRAHYPDFGPTLASEKLLERHDLSVSVSALRHWMIDDGLWLTRRERRKAIHQPRTRRDCYGELVQIDGSAHAWFEDRGPKCTLLVYIDDATGRLMELRFVPTESTFDYFYSTRRYLERHGKPIAFYSDKHSIFRVNQTNATTGNGMTQFGRALHELNIDILCANSPQAKGRVERVNKTLQDRLVKELRLAEINDMASANGTVLESFIETFNAKFARAPKNDTDVHRPLATEDDVERIFSWQEPRTVSRSLTVQYDRVIYLIEPNEFTRDLGRKKITVHDYPDGTIELRHQGRPLPFEVFDRVQQVRQADVVSNKRLGAALAFAKAQQAERSRRAPKRRGQKIIMEDAFRAANPAVATP